MQSDNVVRSFTNGLASPAASRVGFSTSDLYVYGARFHKPNCLGRSLEPYDYCSYGRAISESKRLAKGHYLFRLSEPFEAMFIILSGSVKSCRPDEDGNEHIFGFHTPGELLALDAIGSRVYSSYIKFRRRGIWQTTP